MPGFDGTGPRGQGQMTGRGLGYCVQPASSNMYGGGRGRGFGRGMGLGYARGNGFGFRAQAQNYYPLYSAPVNSKEDELAMLKQQSDYLQADLKEIQSRIEQLSK